MGDALGLDWGRGLVAQVGDGLGHGGGQAQGGETRVLGLGGRDRIGRVGDRLGLQDQGDLLGRIGLIRDLVVGLCDGTGLKVPSGVGRPVGTAVGDSRRCRRRARLPGLGTQLLGRLWGVHEGPRNVSVVPQGVRGCGVPAGTAGEALPDRRPRKGASGRGREKQCIIFARASWRNNFMPRL
jgi:hypothetical protein